MKNKRISIIIFIIISTTLIAIFTLTSLIIVEDLKDREPEINLAEIREVNVTTGYIFGKPVYTKHGEVVVNSSKAVYLPLDILIKPELALKQHFGIVFEACGDLESNKPFEFKRTLIINATKNISRYDSWAWKVLVSSKYIDEKSS